MMASITRAEDFGRVAVLLGGQSAEREISLISGEAILTALQQQHIDAHRIDVGDDVGEQLAVGQFDRAFVALHGRGGEDGQIQGLLQTIGLPYTGSGVSGAALSMNKRLSKLLWQQQGLPTALFEQVNQHTDAEQLLRDIPLPWAIKPVNEGSSIGLNKVTQTEQFGSAVALALNYDQDVIAESWIEGEEYTVAVLDGTALPVVRLKTAGGFYDFAAKYKSGTTEYLCPCGLAEKAEKQCQQLAVRAFEALDMEGWGRIDLIRDQQGHFYLLEANSVPGMTDHSLVPMAAKVAGMNFEQLVWRILETSLEERH